MRALIFLLGAFALVGCDLSKMSMARATKVCTDVNSTLYTAEYFNGAQNYKITCKDGQIVEMSLDDFQKITGPKVAEYINKKENNENTK